MTFNWAVRTGAAALAATVGFAAQAATLGGIQGGILVSQGGGGYRLVSGPAQLRVGDTVLANPGASAQVAYDDGCVVAIKPGMVFTVTEISPCKAGQPVQAAGSNWPLILGGVAVAGGVGIALAAGGGGGPSSP
ncbi:MAG: hypothetical protein KJZ80_16330 [Hyphomicrobiaceae bacterium]|nr:hypothetical protein [Hyphomicrobiaceae bacterium]